MLNKKETLVLFGRSPFINEIKEEIPLLIHEYDTMGCNFFCNTFPDVKYVIFYDDIVPTVSKDSTIITNILHYKDPRKKSCKLCRTHKNIQFYVINRVKREIGFSKFKDNLNFYIHTPSMALNWAWQKGYKNVVLAGIDLNYNKPEHFDSNNSPDQCKFTLREDATLNSRWHLENIATKYLNLYQLNPESTINIPKISVEELLS